MGKLDIVGSDARGSCDLEMAKISAH